VRAASALAGTIASISPQLIFIALMMAAVVFFGQRFGLFGDQITLGAASAVSFGGEERSVELFTLLPKDGIRSIDDPSFIAAGDAEWSPTTPVIGLSINGDARAYPLPVLAAHEIVNDVGGGSAVAITYCPLCLTGIVFDRSVAGSVVEFGVSGKLLMNVLVMYDRDTDSLWSQILREAITGPHRGTSLVLVDSLQTTWSTWRNLHPQTLILDERGRNDSYASYYRNNDSGVHGGLQRRRPPRRAHAHLRSASQRPRRHGRSGDEQRLAATDGPGALRTDDGPGAGAAAGDDVVLVRLARLLLRDDGLRNR